MTEEKHQILARRIMAAIHEETDVLEVIKAHGVSLGYIMGCCVESAHVDDYIDAFAAELKAYVAPIAKQADDMEGIKCH